MVLKQEGPTKSQANWRLCNFANPKGETEFGIGTLSISRGTFALGHKVSLINP